MYQNFNPFLAHPLHMTAAGILHFAYETNFRLHPVLSIISNTQIQGGKEASRPGGLLADLSAPNRASASIIPSPAHAHNIDTTTLQYYLVFKNTFLTSFNAQLQDCITVNIISVTKQLQFQIPNHT